MKILTLHASKGLEFPLVIVSRVGEGRLPFRFGALPPEELTARIEQQRRLLYVGCSRAMRALLVCVHAAAPSVLDAVYNEAQALRGQALYYQHCLLCHGETMAGVDKAPALAKHKAKK